MNVSFYFSQLEQVIKVSPNIICILPVVSREGEFTMTRGYSHKEYEPIN